MKNMKKSLKNKEKTQKKRKKYDIFKKISIFFNKLIFPDDIKCVFCGKKNLSSEIYRCLGYATNICLYNIFNVIGVRIFLTPIYY